MAVSKINKFHIFAHLSLKESLLKELQKLSCVEITKIEKKALFHEWEKIEENPDENIASESNKVKFCIDLFNLYKDKDTKKSDRAIYKKETIDYEELSKIISNFNYDEIYQNCKNLDSELNNLKLQKSKLNNTFYEIQDWEKLELDLIQTNKSRYIDYILATVNKNILNKIKEDLAQKNILNIIEIVKEEKNNLKVVIVSLKEKSDELKKIIQKHQVEIFNYSQPLTGTPKQIMENIKSELNNIDNRLAEIADQIRNIGKENKEIYKIYDYLTTVKEKETVKENMRKSENTFVIKGWIKNKEIPKLEKKLDEYFKEYEIFFTEPEREDQVPVSLENHKLVEPFEVITELYSLPNYFEMDPTPILSIFYFIFFGLCLSDVGYGAAIAIICFLAIRKFKLEGSAKKFLTLLYYCGIAGIFGGILVGSWFGDILNYLPPFLSGLRDLLTQKIALFDPTNNPIPLLILSLVLGVIHVYIGIILKFIDNLKNNKLADGVMDQISWLLFLTGIILFLIKSMLPPYFSSIAWFLLLFGMLILVFTQGRSNKNIIMRIGSGILSLYNITGYFSDVLSYSRLFALGLATGIIATMFNMLATMVDIPFVGIILTIIILFIGHVFNLLISGLSAFIHDARLQYVEFFTKFYQAGGNSFQPFGLKTTYVKIKEKND